MPMSRCVFWHNLFGLLCHSFSDLYEVPPWSQAFVSKLFTVKVKLKTFSKLFILSPLFCCHLSLGVKKRSVLCYSQITWGAEFCFQLPVLLPGCCGAQNCQGPWRVPGLSSLPSVDLKCRAVGSTASDWCKIHLPRAALGKLRCGQIVLEELCIRSGQKKSHCVLQRVPPLVCE